MGRHRKRFNLFSGIITNLVMTSRTLRRRLHHADVDGKRQEHLETSDLDGLNEPLLGNYSNGDRHSEVRLLLIFCGLMIQ